MIICSTAENFKNLFRLAYNLLVSSMSSSRSLVDPGYLKILEEIFAKETKNQLGRKSTVRILSENALTGKEIIF